MSLTMSSDERQAFLAGVHVGVIAIEREGRAPLAVPVWYSYEPGGEVRMLIDIGSVKDKLLRVTQRFSLAAQQETPPYKYVTAEGPVVAFEEQPPIEVLSAMAHRYLPADAAEAYVAYSGTDNSVLVRMRPEKWLSTDYSKLEL